MHKCEGIKEGPIPNEIIEFMRNEHDEICRMSPTVGTYLRSADVRKWASCHFH
ncbi:unnamed protein product [Brassica rapa]|uniref:Uncharacterized protein n=1 Tax=Brassica campestris TaxID=3711 RepID=A0A3P5Z6E0_BRACM|nr:unnamed protein product [Brassica rapa]VDC71345.1 unnamed protein product [Brassica rapa]